MIRVLNARSMRQAEKRAVDEGIATLEELMDRAGQAVAAQIMERFESGRVVVCAGGGNNAGDGWVAARTLHQADFEVLVIALTAPQDLLGPAAHAATAAVEAGVEWRVLGLDELSALLEPADIIIDALLGIGVKGGLREPLATVVRHIREAGGFVVSVDLPTGVITDDGQVPGHAVSADLTVTFSAVKPALVLQPAASLAGEVVVVDLGIPSEMLGASSDPEIREVEEYRRLVPVPAPDTHKRSRGSVLVIAGSVEYPGAALLAAQGAQRMGAGYVTLAVPEPIVSIAQSHCRSIVVKGLAAELAGCVSLDAVEQVYPLVSEHDAVVIGPGLTTQRPALEFVRRMITAVDVPLVLDADALSALSGALDSFAIRRHSTVITPHVAELGRVLGMPAERIDGDRLEYATRLAGKDRVCVLKGAPTVVAGDGRRLVNASGGPALATAGTGDILAGVIGALLAQGLGALDAGSLGVYLHGRAGDIAAADLTPVCVTAEDVLDRLPDAVAEVLDWTW